MINLLLLSSALYLQPGLYPILYQPASVTYIRYWDQFNAAGVYAGDSVNDAVKVNCVLGCGGGPGAGLTDAELRATPVPMSISSSVPLAVTGTFWQVTQPVSIASTVGVTQSTSPWVISGAVTGSGNFTVVQGTGTNLHTVVDSGSITTVPPSNASTNVTQFGSNAVVTGTGAGGVGIPRVTISNDSSLAANQSVNLAQVAAATVATGNGTAAGSIRVSLASDSTGNSGVAQASTTSGQLGHLVQGAVTTANPTYTTAQTSPLSITTNGLLRTDPYSNRFVCALDGIGTTLTQCQAAPGAGLRLIVTTVIANSTTATAGTFAIRQGTGSNCGTGTAGFLPGASTSRTYVLPANTAAAFQFNSVSGLPATAATALCVIGVVTNTTNITITGYIAP